MRAALPWLVAATLAGWGAGVAAQECRLALVLALDVSSSVDEREDRLQRDGLAAALLAPSVSRAFLAAGPVALHAFEWSGRRAQAPLLPGWRMIETEEDLRQAAAAIAGSRRSHADLPTAVGAALGHAAGLLRDGPECRRRTIDVAGDGISNDGFGPTLAYANFPVEGVTVNALIVADPARPREEGAQLIAWFQAEVLRGPGAFSLVAAGYEDYARAMEAKLLRELAMPAVSGLARPRDAG